MKYIVCETCKKMVTMPAFPQLGPDGWIEVSRHREHESDTSAEYCSPACAVIALTDHLQVVPDQLKKASA